MMDIIKKRQYLSWTIGVLILMNAVTLTFLWLGRSEHAPAESNAEIEMLSRDRHMIRLLRDELNLNEEQTSRIYQLRTEYFDEQREISRKIMESRRTMMQSTFQPGLDSALIAKQAQETGEVFARREYITARHFQRMRDVCQPAQRKRFETLMRDMMPRGDQQMPGRGLRRNEPGRPGRGRISRPEQE